MTIRVAVCVLLSFLPWAASAHDASSLNLIGFSDDGKVFAYEEYSDKDLAKYAIIHVIDTTTGREIGGAPVAVEIDSNGDDEKRANMSLQAVRREVWAGAKSLLGGFKVPNKPAILFAAAPGTQQNAQGAETGGDQVLRFCTSLLCTYAEELEVRLKTHAVKPHDFCKGSKPMGFRLIVTRSRPAAEGKTDTVSRVLWNSSLGQSDKCVDDYRIEQIVGDEDGHFIAMIAYWYPVIEGPHKRYLAVPLAVE